MKQARRKHQQATTRRLKGPLEGSTTEREKIVETLKGPSSIITQVMRLKDAIDSTAADAIFPAPELDNNDRTDEENQSGDDEVNAGAAASSTLYADDDESDEDGRPIDPKDRNIVSNVLNVVRSRALAGKGKKARAKVEAADEKRRAEKASARVQRAKAKAAAIKEAGRAKARAVREASKAKAKAVLAKAKGKRKAKNSSDDSSDESDPVSSDLSDATEPDSTDSDSDSDAATLDGVKVLKDKVIVPDEADADTPVDPCTVRKLLMNFLIQPVLLQRAIDAIESVCSLILWSSFTDPVS